MTEHDPRHYRFQRSGNLDDDPLLRRQQRRENIMDAVVTLFVVASIIFSVWMFT